jgi:hypothetical protein
MLPLLAAAGLALAALLSPDPPRPVLVVDVRLALGEEARPHSILVRDGRIERVGEGRIEAPPDARTIDGRGALALPAFVDAYSFAGCVTPEPKAQRDLPPRTSTDVLVDMRDANRKGIQLAFRAADAFDAGETLANWRKQGFGALLSSPSGQILGGQSALVVTAQIAPRDAIVHASVFDHASFQAGGPGYPDTLMGSIAQLRQFLLDAARHARIAERRAQGQSGPRLPFDADLLAAGELLAQRRRVCAAVDSADDVDRFLKLSDEHGFQLAFAGGREAWRRAAELAKRGIPVILVPGGGDEPEDPDAPEGDVKKKKEPDAKDAPWTYVEPVASKREKRRLWVETRDGARVLATAGVRIAFGTGKGEPKDLLERVRALVAAGLPRDVALAALTSGAAEILGAAPGLGRIAPGADASFALWTADPLATKDAAVRWTFVDGRAYEFEIEEKKDAPKDGADDGAGGSWSIAYDEPAIPPGSMDLAIAKDGSATAKLRGATPSGEPVEVELKGARSGATLTLSGRLAVGEFDGEITLSGALDGDAWKGLMKGTPHGGVGFSAQRTPKKEGL